MPVTQAWWINIDPIFGICLFVASMVGVGLIVGACVCVQRRKKTLEISVNGKCAPVPDLEEGSPTMNGGGGVMVNNNSKLLQNMNSLLCNGSLPRHTELPPPPTPPHHPLSNGCAFPLPPALPGLANGHAGSGHGSASTLPLRYSPVSAPRFEAQLSRSSQCDRELPPVPPPDPGLPGESAGGSAADLPLARRREEVAELEEEDDSQYDLIARRPKSTLTTDGLSASSHALLAQSTSPGSAGLSAAGASSAASLPGAGQSAAARRSVASMVLAAASQERVGVAPGVGGGHRTLTSGTIDSDAGSEVDPLYACIKPSRQSLSRLVGPSSLHSTPLHGARERERMAERGGSLDPLGEPEMQHVYSYIRKQASSPVYQALPRGQHVSLGRRSLRGSIESYASLGGTGVAGAAPTIPDRGYGQSEVDLVEEVRRQSSLGCGPGSSPTVSALAGGGAGPAGLASRHRRRSQPGGVLLRVACAGAGAGEGDSPGRCGGGLAVDGRRQSQPAMASDDESPMASSGQEPTPSAAVREASYQRVTVRESIASLRARNALPQTGAAPSTATSGAVGNQSLSLTDDTSSLYERLDQPLPANRRSMNLSFREAFSVHQQQQQPLLAPRAAVLASPHPHADLGGDFYAEISGDEASEAYGEGDIVSALSSGLRHSSSGPVRLMGGADPAVLPGSGADRVLIEMSGFRHIDSDLDVSQTGTPISTRRGFCRPLSPPPDGSTCPGMSAAAAHRRSLMTPLMERSIEGSLFDDGASALDGHYTGCYCTSASSEYERLPGGMGPGTDPAGSPASPTAPGPTLARADSPLLGEPVPEVMTDSGLSCGGGSMPALLPSPPMMRPQRFVHGSGPGSGHQRGHSSSLSGSSAFHSMGAGACADDLSRRDSSSGIASRASQASSVEASVGSGSPPTSHPASCCSNGSSPFATELPLGGIGVVLAPVPREERSGVAERMSRGGRLMSHLLSSFRRKSKPQMVAVSAASGCGPVVNGQAVRGGALSVEAVGKRQRSQSESSSIL